MALAVNKVLTAVYHAAFDDALEGDELVLLTAPLAATTEVQALYDSGIIDFESAVPAALHSLGSSAVEIECALKRRRKLDAEQKEAESAQKETESSAAKIELEVKQAGVGQTKANTEKTKADTALARKQATAPVASSSSSSK